MAQPQVLADIVKLHRKEAKLSRVQLAEMAGVGKTVIFDIEKGKETIQLDTLRKILKVLNVKIEFSSPLMTNFQNIGNEKS
ncbi:MAG TPA: helix-turn-helix transcriptional regulator [Bacteroidales bacterium]|nr:helix-turn-helix transcriptional regulator [Bacteroidales bacterium]